MPLWTLLTLFHQRREAAAHTSTRTLEEQTSRVS